jgi:cytoskeletal protein CcmA (bactofilin family)
LVTGNFINLGEVRNGPNYASYDTATLEIHIGGNFTQNNSYGGVATHFMGAQAQTIIYAEGKDLGGTFIDDDPKTPIKAGSAISATATSLTLGSTTLGRGTLDMGTFALTLKTGDFKVLNGLLIANKIIGVLGATLSADQIQVGSTSLALEGDVCTASTTITGSVTVAASSVLYNQSNVDAVVIITGNLENNGTVRKGPGYAAYGEGTMTLHLAGNLAQNGVYTPTATHLNGIAAQTISLLAGKTLVGSFTDTTPATPIVAGSDLTIGAAEFILSKDATSPASTLSMGAFKIIHPSGNLKIATGTLEANDLTGGTSGETVFSISAIVPPSGTLSVANHFPTGNMTVTGNLTVQPGAKVYNQVHVEAHLTVTGTVSNLGIMGSGPGYASYDTGVLFLNGEKLPGWQ